MSKVTHEEAKEVKILKKYSALILKDLTKRRNAIKKKIEKNNDKMVEAPLSDVGTMRYWRRRQAHDVLMQELEKTEEDIKIISKICDLRNVLHQHRFNFIDDELIEIIKGDNI